MGLLPRSEAAAVGSFIAAAVGAIAWANTTFLGRPSVLQTIAMVTAWVWWQRLCASGFTTWTFLPLWRSGPSLSGRVFVVTGANTGIGYWTAAQLHRQGATVVITTRRSHIGKATASSIQHVSGGTAPIYNLTLELGDPESVKRFPEAFKALRLGTPISCLINNAGAFGYPDSNNDSGHDVPTLSKFDGVEYTLGCNALGPWLLTESCRPLLDPKSGRVVFVASAAHRIIRSRASLESVLAFASDKAALSAPDAELPSLAKQFELYGLSKYINIVNSRVLWKRHRVEAASVHPGVVLTDFARNMPAIFGVVMKNPLVMPLLSLLGKTSYEGCLTSIKCATEKGVANGHYHIDCQEANGRLTAVTADVANDIPILEWVNRQLVPHVSTA